MHTETLNGVKILSNIEPFNDLWYGDCFYQAFFSIVKYYGLRLNPFLLNFIYSYDMSFIPNTEGYEGLVLDLKGVETKPVRQIVQDICIKTNKQTISSNIVDNIINAINNNHPVMLLIDIYYQPWKISCFQKEHNLHYIIVFGYDLNRREFHIIDHLEPSSFNYKKCTLSFTDITNCHNGYLNNFHGKSGFYEYYMEDTELNNKSIRDLTDSNYMSVFLEKMFQGKSQILDSLKYLDAFCDEYANLGFENFITKDSIEKLYLTSHYLIINQEMRLYTLKNVFTIKYNLDKILQKIIDNWRIVRSIILKYKKTNIIANETYKKIIRKLSQIRELDHESFEKEFAMLEEYSAELKK